MNTASLAQEETKTGYSIDITRIMELLPHRYPFLLVDRMVDLVPGESAVGIKNVSVNEPFFVGHFPQKPVMPGVLIVECMAQTCGIVVMESLGEDLQGKLVYFMSVDGVKFRKVVTPGDQLNVHVKKLQNKGLVFKFECEAKVEGVRVAEGVITAMIVDKDK